MLSDSQRLEPSPLSASHPWPAGALLAASLIGIALLATFIVMGPATFASMRLTWLAAFLALLAGVSLWWALFLWLLNRLAGLGPREGLNRSVVLIALLSLSLPPDLAILLAGRLPYALPFDAGSRSLYLWMVAYLVFLVFVGQELVLAGAVQRKSLRDLAVERLVHLSTLPRCFGHLPASALRQIRRHPLLVAIMAAGIAQRLAAVADFHPGDMNDTLSVVYTLLSWPPFRYYHDYSAQRSVYAHLPLYPILMAPFYWLFENVARWPTFWSAKIVSATADLVVAGLIYYQAKGVVSNVGQGFIPCRSDQPGGGGEAPALRHRLAEWRTKGRWSSGWALILAAAWLLSPLVVTSDDHATTTATAFTIAALASLKRAWLCGLMIGLGAATRNEAVFLALPLMVHFIAKREPRESVAFLGAFSTTLAAVAMPFVLTDPKAIDYAMRLQSLRQAGGELPSLLKPLQPYLATGLVSLLQQNPTLLTTVVILPVSLLAMRDGRATRVVLVVALAYLLTLPVLHPRYMVFSFAGGLYYAARFGNPLVAVAIAAATWPGTYWASVAQLALAAVLAAIGQAGDSRIHEQVTRKGNRGWGMGMVPPFPIPHPPSRNLLACCLGGSRTGSKARTVSDVVLVSVVSLGLRTLNLLSLPLFLDEATHLNWALEIWEQRTRTALAIPIVADGKQPLFMLLAGAASYLFSDPLVAGRMVSALAGVASAVGIYLAGYWLAGRQVGLLAGLLYALVPFSLFYDRLALMEALLNAGGVWTLALSVFIAGRAHSTRSAAWAGLGLGVALGVALWAKLLALLMLPFPFLCALLLARRGKLRVSATGFAIGAMVLAALATPLFLAPEAASMWSRAGDRSTSLEALLTLPLELWRTNALRFWSWVEAYLPAPLWWLVPASVVWGLARRTRLALLLLGCWAAFTMPAVLTRYQFESRYVFPGVFPLLLLSSALLAAFHQALRTVGEQVSPWVVAHRPVTQLAAIVLFLALMGPTLWFDLQLLNTPESAPLPPSDYQVFVTDWSAGYGFPEVVRLVKQRAAELTRDGQPVIVLGYYRWGHAHAGLKLYLRGMPGVFLYVDSHLARDAEGFMAAWKSHRVPILLVGNEGSSELDRLDQFERGVPQAKTIGLFPKPGGQSYFKVYEIDVADLEP